MYATIAEDHDNTGERLWNFINLFTISLLFFASAINTLSGFEIRKKKFETHIIFCVIRRVFIKLWYRIQYVQYNNTICIVTDNKIESNRWFQNNYQSVLFVR